MRKRLLWLLPAVFFITISVLFISVSRKDVWSLPSKFEGKKISSVEFFGIRKDKDGKQEVIPLKNADESDLKDICNTKKGTIINGDEIREDIKDLVEEMYFLDVKVEVQENADGVSVRFYCEERPVIANLNLKGIEELQESTLLDKVLVQEGDPLREDLIKESVNLLREKYIEEGFFNSIITYKIKKNTEEEEKDAVDVDIIIDEGEEAKVQKITILGTYKISDWKLKSVMETEEAGFIADGKFSRAKYEQDKAKILAYYREFGYLDADILEDKLDYEWVDPEEQDERGIYITMRVKEGDIYYFDSYTLEGNVIVPTAVIEPQFELKAEKDNALKRFLRSTRIMSDDEDVICNDTMFQKDRFMIGMEYGNRGYLFARVTPVKTISEREKIVDGKKVRRKYVHYKLNIFEGKQAYIENIIIKGNKKTKDKVIRREILLKEGELYNASKLQMTREKLFRLGYFKEVNVDIRPGSTDEKVNLVFSVIEQQTGTVSLGGGYGTNSGFSVFATVGENNLLGYGYKVNGRFEYSPIRTAVTVSFTDPWFLDYPVSFTTALFYQINTSYDESVIPDSSELATYRQQTFGYSLGFAYRFWYYNGVGTTWTHAFKSTLEPSGNASDEIMKLQSLGMQQKKSMTLYTYYDNKDSDFNPTKGMRAYFGTTFVGGFLLRGDDHYTQMDPEFDIFYTPFNIPFTEKYPCVIQGRFSGSFIRPPIAKSAVRTMQNPNDNPWLEIDDRLLLGGPETLRGWDYFDEDMPASWKNKLYHRILYGFEFRFPIHLQYLWGALFFDAGSLWSDSFWETYDSNIDAINSDKTRGDLRDIKEIYKLNEYNIMEYFRYSWGIGFRVQIPMLPIRFWFGKKAEWAGISNGGFKAISDYNFQIQFGEMAF